MHPVISALLAAARDLREPRMMMLALVPPLVALAVWIALVWAFADDWARWVGEWIATSPWLAWLRDWGLSSALIWASGIAAFAALIPVMLIVAVLATDILAMPVIVPRVGRRHFPRLEQRRGGTVVGSAWNAVTSILLFAALWLLSLPFWLTGIGALLMPALTSAFYSQRALRYDALAEHASATEYRAVVESAGGKLYGLGLALAVLYYVPVLNLLAPIVSALAFTHLCLAELDRLRARPT